MLFAVSPSEFLIEPRIDRVQIFIEQHESDDDDGYENDPNKDSPPSIERDKIDRIASGRDSYQARYNDHDEEILPGHG